MPNVGIRWSPVNSPHKGPVTWKKVSIWWCHHVIGVWCEVVVHLFGESVGLVIVTEVHNVFLTLALDMCKIFFFFIVFSNFSNESFLQIWNSIKISSVRWVSLLASSPLIYKTVSPCKTGPWLWYPHNWSWRRIKKLNITGVNWMSEDISVVQFSLWYNRKCVSIFINRAL